MSIAFVAFLMLSLVPSLPLRLPVLGLLGIAAGVLSIAAVTVGRDRSWMVWIGVAVAALLIGDLLKALIFGG